MARDWHFNCPHLRSQNSALRSHLNATFTVGNGYDLGIRGLTFEDRTVDMRGRMAPQLTFGYEKTGERSAFRFGAASDVEGRDVRAVSSWNLRF